MWIKLFFKLKNISFFIIPHQSAQKHHAYCMVVQALLRVTHLFRILALSATPGDDIETVQLVINNLVCAFRWFKSISPPFIYLFIYSLVFFFFLNSVDKPHRNSKRAKPWHPAIRQHSSSGCGDCSTRRRTRRNSGLLAVKSSYFFFFEKKKNIKLGGFFVFVCFFRLLLPCRKSRKKFSDFILAS